MGTIITWIVIFAILCGCLFLWTFSQHRHPQGGDGDGPSCDGDCLNCAKNFDRQFRSKADCEESDAGSDDTKKEE